MSESDLTNFLYLSGEQAANSFQFWLSASFALVMASYFGGGKLNGLVFKLLAIVYLLASVTFASYWISASVQWVEYESRMAQQGYETAHLNNIYGWLGGAGMISTFVIGTIGVLYYLRWEFRHRNIGT
jgi:hypothetical protein